MRFARRPGPAVPTPMNDAPMTLPTQMPALAIREPGGPEVLTPVQRSLPQPQAGELLIEVAASGVNRPDVLQRKGLYPPPPGASDLPGLEVAGRVVGGDPEALAARGLRLGQAVCALTHGGGYARYAVAPAGQVLPVPAGLSLIEAASLPETCFTVWINAIERAALQPGETILIHGGSSGIGVTAIQIAKALGATVFVTVGDAVKAAACVALGADAAIVYKTQDFVDETLRLTGGRGVDVILDMVAGDYIERGLRCLAEDGRLSVISLQGGSKATLDVGRLQRRRLTLTGSTLRPRTVEFKARVAAALQARVWPLIEAGRIRPVVHRVLPASAAAEAHALMESSAHIGKIVLDWSGAAA